MRWRPRQLSEVAVRGHSLSALDGLVLSRLDGATLATELPTLTGLAPERVEEILVRLVRLGVVEAPEEAAPSLDAGTQTDPDPEPEGPQEEAAPAQSEDDVRLRARFAQVLQSLTVEERALRAPAAVEPDLSALCFDPSGQVVLALLRNPRFGLGQARLVARHHRDGHGLEALCANAAYANDEVVRRELLKNPQLQAGVIRRLWAGRRPLEQWKWSASREVTEQSRRTLREVLRARFSTCTPEDRLEVILKTEGRALASLAGLPIDSKTTAMLCARSYGSATLVQHLARWSAAPPVLVAHLLRQPLVQRQPALRTLLAAHPNAPRG